MKIVKYIQNLYHEKHRHNFQFINKIETPSKGFQDYHFED